MKRKTNTQTMQIAKRKNNKGKKRNSQNETDQRGRKKHMIETRSHLTAARPSDVEHFVREVSLPLMIRRSAARLIEV